MSNCDWRMVVEMPFISKYCLSLVADWKWLNLSAGLTADVDKGLPSVLTKAYRDLQRQITSLTRLQSASSSRTSCAVTNIHAAFDKLRSESVFHILLLCMNRCYFNICLRDIYYYIRLSLSEDFDGGKTKTESSYKLNRSVSIYYSCFAISIPRVCFWLFFCKYCKYLHVYCMMLKLYLVAVFSVKM